MKANDIFASRFKLTKRLNPGTMSEVWMAFDTHSAENELVALKILAGSQDSLIRELYYRETEALTLITNRNIVTLLDFGFDEGNQRYWMAFEYIRGRNLEDYMKSLKGKPDLWNALEIMGDIVEAIAVAHANNIIHRDLKPSNIMLDETGTSIVLDFGIAKIKSSLQEQMTVRAFGTLPYASPEQSGNGEIDVRTDIYSLGGILLYLLTGNAPASNLNLFDQVKKASLTTEQRELLLEMVDLDPANRFPSILDVKRSLTRMLDYERKSNTVIYSRITQRVIDSMESLGIVNSNRDVNGAIAWLNTELNSTEIFVEETDYNDYFLYTSKYRIKFNRDAEYECIYFIELKQLASADSLSSKGWALPFKAAWRIIHKNGLPPRDADVEELFNEITNHKAKLRVKKQRDARLKSTVVQWEKILRLQRKLLIENSFSLEYNSWDISEDGANIELRLVNHQNRPDLLVNQPLLISNADGKQVSFGTCFSIEGNIMNVSLSRGVNSANFKTSGEVFLDDKQVAVALKRQEDAIRMTRYGEARNPKLFSMIEDPNLAHQLVDIGSIESLFHKDLDDAKKIAVEKALRSEMYLVQGPPGTGKTEFISEVTAQILSENPHARILLTSQSNAAVDNALESIISLLPEASALRIGRSEKIDKSLSNIQLEEVMDKWTEKTKLKSNEFAGMAQMSSAQDVTELANLSELLKETKELTSDLEILEKEASILRYQVFEAENNQDYEAGDFSSLEKKLSRIKDKLIDVTSEIQAGLELLGHSLNVKTNKPLLSLQDFTLFQGQLEKALDECQKRLSKSEVIELIRQEWLKRLGKGRDFEEICARESSVVACTCLGVANVPGIWNATYDWVIVDEAARATPPEILVPLVRGKRMVLVGDHKQLPPVIEAGLTTQDLEILEIEIEELERSLFETIYEKADDSIKTFLDVQYRMHPGIGKLISDVFYARSIRNGASTELQLHNFEQWTDKSVVWISTSKIEERFERPVNTSRQNQLEARIVRDCCEKIVGQKNDDLNFTIGIISGYAEQKKLLEQLITPKDKNKWENIMIEIDNVDAFQGKQRDVIIYSIVRSNRQGDIGFLKDFRRLNVALSRARKMLIIVGDHEMLQNAHTGEMENYFAKVLRHIVKEDPKRCMLEVLAQ